jgi:hypothetical protein
MPVAAERRPRSHGRQRAPQEKPVATSRYSTGASVANGLVGAHTATAAMPMAAAADALTLLSSVGDCRAIRIHAAAHPQHMSRAVISFIKLLLI